MDHVAIANEVCNFQTDHIDIAIGWICAIFGKITHADFIEIVKHTLPGNDQALATMKSMVQECLPPEA